MNKNGMSKKYMIEATNFRIKELEKEYRKYFDTDNGPSRSLSGAACIRSRIKKDLGILRLLDYLLKFCPENMQVTDAEMMQVFDRYTEPRKLK